MGSRHKKIKKLFSSVIPAGWRKSSDDSSTPAAELSAVVATKDINVVSRLSTIIWGSGGRGTQVSTLTEGSREPGGFHDSRQCMSTDMHVWIRVEFFVLFS